MAVALSKYYGAACLSMDTVVTEAISDKSSWAGLRARELCLRAAIEQSQKETEDSGKERHWTQSSTLGTHHDRPLLLAFGAPGECGCST